MPGIRKGYRNENQLLVYATSAQSIRQRQRFGEFAIHCSMIAIRYSLFICSIFIYLVCDMRLAICDFDIHLPGVRYATCDLRYPSTCCAICDMRHVICSIRYLYIYIPGVRHVRWSLFVHSIFDIYLLDICMPGVRYAICDINMFDIRIPCVRCV